MNQALVGSAIEWTRPAGLLALALPLLVLLFAHRRPRARLLATGTLEVWSRIDRRTQAASGARRTIPLAIWLLASALAAGALALAGPAPRVERAPRTWRVVVDRSPSMYLADGDATRLEKALVLARDELARAMQPGDDLLWLSTGDTDATAQRSAEPPAAWLAAPEIVQAEPEWSAYDEGGMLWLTDRAPLEQPNAARVCASGGREVHGPVAVEGTTRWDWDGADLVEVPGGCAPRAVRIEGSATLPDLVVAVCETWRAARGLDVASSTEPAALTLRASAGGAARTSGAERTVGAARDGWSARGVAQGEATSADREGPLAPWLAGREPGTLGDAVVLVTAGPGRIDCAFVSLEEPAGDPAAFAVSWARLFDDALLAPPGVVALAERLSAGEAARIEPAREPTDLREATVAGVSAWPAACAFVAFVLALGAIGVARARP